MINVLNPLMTAWYSLLSGNVNVPVYRVDVPGDATDYVIIRPESDSDRSNNTQFHSNAVIVTEVVTRFGSGELINDSAAHDIDGLIANLVLPNTSTHSLPVQAGIQVISIKRQNIQTVAEDDGQYRYYRVITRNIHRIRQT
jgi:hypothetical protein